MGLPIVKNQEWFMGCDPTELGSMTNKLGQKITFYEHPTKGDEDTIYFTLGGNLYDSGFFETDDMEATHGEYTPLLINGEVLFGFEAGKV